MKTTAAIATGPGQDFVLDEVELDAPRSDEILVRVHAAGICHTDIAVREQHLPLPLPAVLGHEGAGVVEAVGSAVTKVKPGDHVLMTFRSCGRCSSCQIGQPAYCVDFNLLNGAGRRPDGSCTLYRNGTELTGAFFGQSSFAGLALSYERNTVVLPADIPFEIAAPFGCGVQTGAGAVLRSLDCQAGSSLVVLGGGTVGLSAILAAVVRQCGPIILSEPSKARRDLALSLGATHVIDPLAGNLTEQLRAICPAGVDHAVDTSGRVDAINEAIECLAVRGSIGLVGMPTVPTASYGGNLYSAIARGIAIRGIVEGDSDPDCFIPELIELYRAGRFPVDRIVRTYPLADINAAVHDQHGGDCVKAVLLTDIAAA